MVNGFFNVIYFLFCDFFKWKNMDGDSIEIILIDPQVQGRIWQGKHGYLSKGDI